MASYTGGNNPFKKDLPPPIPLFKKTNSMSSLTTRPARAGGSPLPTTDFYKSNSPDPASIVPSGPSRRVYGKSRILKSQGKPSTAEIEAKKRRDVESAATRNIPSSKSKYESSDDDDEHDEYGNTEFSKLAKIAPPPARDPFLDSIKKSSYTPPSETTIPKVDIESLEKKLKKQQRKEEDEKLRQEEIKRQLDASKPQEKKKSVAKRKINKNTSDPKRSKTASSSGGGGIMEMMAKKSKSRPERTSEPLGPDSDDDLFEIEGEATKAARLKAEQFKKDARKYFTEEEKKNYTASVMASRHTGQLKKVLKNEEEDDFFSKMKNTTVYVPSQNSMSSDEDILDADLRIGVDNSKFELWDEGANDERQAKIIEEKYKGKEYPGALTVSELEQRINSYLPIIPKILTGQQESVYYARAKQVMKGSRSTTMSHSEFSKLAVNEFTIGYFGEERQKHITTMIKKKYGKEIQHHATKNKTIQFWSIDSFVLYVLSCELALRLAMEDLDMDEDSALEVLDSTRDYGKHFTDKKPLW